MLIFVNLSLVFNQSTVNGSGTFIISRDVGNVGLIINRGHNADDDLSRIFHC